MRVTVRGGGWEPLVSCLAILATLGLTGGWQIMRHARDELREARHPLLQSAE